MKRHILITAALCIVFFLIWGFIIGSQFTKEQSIYEYDIGMERDRIISIIDYHSAKNMTNQQVHDVLREVVIDIIGNHTNIGNAQ